jgi:hypothetical protein
MLLALSHLMHTVEQLADGNGCYTGIKELMSDMA